MNDPTPVGIASPLYEEDAYGWALAQAALLCALKPAGVDWENLAEEAEDLGRQHYDALESALRLLLVHLMKWDAQPMFRSRSWLATIREQHRQFERRLLRSPSLKSSLEDIRAEAFRQALVEVMAETGLAPVSFPPEPLGWNVIRNPSVGEDDLPVR